MIMVQEEMFLQTGKLWAFKNNVWFRANYFGVIPLNDKNSCCYRIFFYEEGKTQIQIDNYET